MEVTALQQLIKYINEWYNPSATPSLEDVLNEAERLKELEKQQIIDAVEWDYKSNMGEVYYNAKYGKANK